MSDDDFRAHISALLPIVQAQADEWWPHHCAEEQAVSTVERKANGRCRLLRHGREWGDDFSRLPDELEGIAIIDVGPERPARDVTPPKRLETFEAAPASPELAPDPAEGMLVDIGEPWQWRPYDR